MYQSKSKCPLKERPQCSNKDVEKSRDRGRRRPGGEEVDRQTANTVSAGRAVETGSALTVESTGL